MSDQVLISQQVRDAAARGDAQLKSLDAERRRDKRCFTVMLLLMAVLYFLSVGTVPEIGMVLFACETVLIATDIYLVVRYSKNKNQITASADYFCTSIVPFIEDYNEEVALASQRLEYAELSVSHRARHVGTIQAAKRSVTEIVECANTWLREGDPPTSDPFKLIAGVRMSIDSLHRIRGW